MKHKTKIISSVSVVLVVVFSLSISAFANSPMFVLMKEWGKALKEKSIDTQSEDVYAVGRNTVITNEEEDYEVVPQ